MTILRAVPDDSGTTTTALTSEDVSMLSVVCPAHTPLGLRDAALIAVVHRMALRLWEARALRDDDVDLAAGRLTVPRRDCALELDDMTRLLLDVWLVARRTICPDPDRHASGDIPALIGELRERARCSQTALARAVGYGQRQVSRWERGDAPLPAGMWSRIEEVLTAQLGAEDLAGLELRLDAAREPTRDETARLPPGSPLFCTVPGGRRLDAKWIQRHLRDLGAAAGVREPVTADALRRARVRELADAGAPLSSLQALLGYSSATAALRYIAQVAPQSRTVREAPPAPAPPPARPARRLQAVRETAGRLVGVPIDDPAWAEVRRGRRPPNYGLKLEPEPLTESEAMAMLYACAEHARTPATAARNQALFVTLWRGGLRIGEAVGRHHKVTGEWIPGLAPKDVDLVNGALRVMRGKGDKFRTAGIDPVGAHYLQRWLEVRHELGIDDTVDLFCTLQRSSRHGPADEYRPLAAPYIRNLLKTLGRRAGVQKRIHPHGLRHTHGFELAMENTPLILVRDQLGHESIATTDKYLRRIAPAQLLRAMQARTFPGGGAEHGD